MRNLSLAALLLVPMACTDPPAAALPDETDFALRMEFGHGQGIAVVGLGDAPAVDSDQLPHYRLYAGARLVDDAAVEAVVEADTSTLAWVDDRGTLWLAPIAEAPEGKRAVAEQVLPALVAAHGRLAFAERIDGPETAAFVIDLHTERRTALDDAPGPDEVLGFSPAGDQVLLLSGRTGLASLFAVGVDTPDVRQLTNAGLRPGPTLDPSKVVPVPPDHRSVAWGTRGVAYRAEAAVIRVAPDGAVDWLEPDVALEEVVR
jgi:hypothetical protein